MALLAKVFELPVELVNEIYTDWASAITVDSLLSRFECQRKARVADFSLLNSPLLANLCLGNQYANFLEKLRADPQHISRISDKSAVFDLIKKCGAESKAFNPQTLSEEALFLHLIGQLDASTWQADWTSTLKRIYG